MDGWKSTTPLREPAAIVPTVGLRVKNVAGTRDETQGPKKYTNFGHVSSCQLCRFKKQDIDTCAAASFSPSRALGRGHKLVLSQRTLPNNNNMPRILSRTSMVQAQQRRRKSYPSAPSLRKVGLHEQQQQAQSPPGLYRRNETKYFSTTLLEGENASPRQYSPLSSSRRKSTPTSPPSLVESLVSSRSSSHATFLGNSSQPSSVSSQLVLNNNHRKSFKKQASLPIVLRSHSSTSTSSGSDSWGLFVDVEEKHAELERNLSASLPTKIR